MHIRKYALLWPRQFRVMTKTESASWSIIASEYTLFSQICIIIIFMRSLNSDSHYWSLSLRTETEKNSGLIISNWSSQKFKIGRESYSKLRVFIKYDGHLNHVENQFISRWHFTISGKKDVCSLSVSRALFIRKQYLWRKRDLIKSIASNYN